MQNQSGYRAVIPRSIACYAILLHVCLFSGEAADITLFDAILLQAIFLPVVLCAKKIRTVLAALILALTPHAVRLFIMLLRLLPMAAFVDSGDPAGFLPYDSALLSYDSTMSVALLPFYWMSLSVLFAVRFPRLRRIFPAADLVVLCALFVFFSAEETNVYKWPVLKLLVFCTIVFLEMLSLVLAAPPSLFPDRREKTAACAVPLVAVIIAGLLLFNPLNERALGSGGGLLRPDMFSFDFAPFLRLENEISMNDDLIFIVRKESKGGGGTEEYIQNNSIQNDAILPNNIQETDTQEDDIQNDGIPDNLEAFDFGGIDGIAGIDGIDDDFLLDDGDFLGFPPGFNLDELTMLLSKNQNILTRRFVLSAYNSAAGFTRDETIDERIQSRRVPSGKVYAEVNGDKRRHRLGQEYYLVNIDGGAFLAMNEPVAVTPFEQYPASSFKAAYKVESLASSAPARELSRAAPPQRGTASGLSDDEFAWFTTYSNPKTGPTATEKRITELAAGLAAPHQNYWDKIQSIYEYLKYGDYLYSLKPGIAADGDQLAYFLFEAKRGYCSYFAFAFASMLRSIGIPCRVAVGFFLDPSTERFGFYPVLANMAHAWVEVWFPGYGWIEYDPTTDNLAPDEQWRFSSGPPGEALERLMKEILDNRENLKEKEEAPPPEAAATGVSLKNALSLAAKNMHIILIIVIYIILLYNRFYLYLVFLYTKDMRKKTLYLYRYACKLAAFGLSAQGIGAEIPEPEGRGIGADSPVFAGTPAKMRPSLASLHQYLQKAKFAWMYTADDYEAARAVYNSFIDAYKTTVPLWKRVVCAAFPPAAAIVKRVHKKIYVLPVVFIFYIYLIFIHTTAIYAQETPRGADELYREGLKAQRSEYWEKAIDVWNFGGQQYPDDVRFFESLGDLYFSREFYRLAKDEYVKAENIQPGDTALLYKLAQTAGSLNEDEAAAAYLERLLAIAPDDRDGINLLGWMYFKLRRLEDGEALITQAIDRLGTAPDLQMMLGTINSGLLRYDASAKAYREAVDEAVRRQDGEFAAIANYNFSILESRFYRYAAAYEKAAASVDLANRTSGRLALGELLIRRLDWLAGIGEYEAAYEMDKSPLSKLSLADTFRLCGRLEEARLYAEDCLKQSNHAWMLNYGIDLNQYKRDIHEILYTTYEGLMHTEQFKPASGPVDALKSVWKRITYKRKGAMHKNLFYKYSFLAASRFKPSSETAASGASAPRIEALLQYYKAFSAYPRRAASYLRPARALETPDIPAAAPSYLLFEGMLQKKPALIEKAIEQFDPVWEQDMAADAYTELCILNAHNAGIYAEKLYTMNPGALRQNGIRLPLRFEVSGTGAGALERRLKKLGVRAARESAGEGRYVLRAVIEEGFAGIELLDTERGFAPIRDTVTLDAGRRGLYAAAEKIAAKVFAVR